MHCCSVTGKVVELGKALKVCLTASCTHPLGWLVSLTEGLPLPGHKGEALSCGLQSPRRTGEPPRNSGGVRSVDCLWSLLPGQLCCHVLCTVSAAVFILSAASVSSRASPHQLFQGASTACCFACASPR